MPKRKERYRARLERKGSDPRVEYTWAHSADQAERNLHIRYPGWSVARDSLERDPPQDNPQTTYEGGVVPPTGPVVGFPIDLTYRHAEDDQAYIHEFEHPAVQMEALPDGSIRLYHSEGKRLWGDY